MSRRTTIEQCKQALRRMWAYRKSKRIWGYGHVIDDFCIEPPVIINPSHLDPARKVQ